MTKKLIFLLVIFSFLIFNCSTTKNISPKKLNKILKTNSEEWTRQDCESVIKGFTQSNLINYEQNIVSLSYLSKKVFIKATPLNLNVIQAKARREAIDRRLNKEQYYQILIEKLEFFTNLSLNTETGELLSPDLQDDIKKEFSFDVYFENISDPHQVIELEGAYDGFFLENKDGNFGRVVGITGYFADEYFILDGTLQVTITFSCIDDKGKDLFPSGEEIKEYSLVFNGLESKPIVMKWLTRTKD
jgi:hypothetical protein